MTRDEFLQKLPGWEKDYQPSAAVLDKIGRLKLLMFIGPSGAGKTTIIRLLGLHYVPSDTTRGIRSGEKPGEDYVFRDDYGRIAGEIEHRHFVQIVSGPEGDLYATRSDSYPDSGTAVMAVMAKVVPVFRNLGFGETISAYITPPSYDEWMNRLNTHYMDDEERQKRLSEARESLIFALHDEQTHYISTDTRQGAVNQIRKLLDGQIDADREKSAREAAAACLDRLN